MLSIYDSQEIIEYVIGEFLILIKWILGDRIKVYFVIMGYIFICLIMILEVVEGIECQGDIYYFQFEYRCYMF